MPPRGIPGFTRKFRIPYGDTPFPKQSSYPDAPWDTTVATLVVALDGTGDFDNIQAAIDDLPSTGGVVYIKEGTYDIDSAIIIDKANVQILGAGKATHIQATTADIIGFNITSADTILQNFKVTGNGTSINANGVQVLTTGSILMSEVIIEDFPGEGIRISAATNSIVSGCKIKNVDSDGISLLTSGTAAEYNIISNCILEDIGGQGIVVQGSNNVITGNIINGSGTEQAGDVHGIAIFADNNVITGNRVKDSQDNDIDLGGSTDTNVVVANVTIGTGSGIVDGGTLNEVSGNT